MRSEDILLQQLPDELRLLVTARESDIVDYFFQYDIEERRLADALSRYATATDDILLHTAAAEVYQHCLPYLDDAFQLAFYHEWRLLELTDFKERHRLESFLQNREHPAFDLIPESYYDDVELKLKEQTE